MRKKLFYISCIFLLFIIGGCGASEDHEDKVVNNVEENSDINIENSQSSQEVFAMDTYMTVTAYGANSEEAVQAAAEEITRLDSLLSTGIETSEVAKINQNGGGSLSEDGAYLMERAMELYDSTDGNFDIAIYPIMDAWGFTTKEYKVPEADTLTERLTLTDASQIFFDAKTSEVTFGVAGMQIDFGGIAKGYTSTRVLDIFRENGVTSGMVNLGGNVQVLGTKTDGSKWRVAIENPDESGMLGVLSIEDSAVITSGGYERYFEEDGITYHHIIDPKTGYPAQNGLTSVTIVSPDGTLADGLSTSFFIMGKEKATEYWRAHSDEFGAVLMSEDGMIYVTENLKESFTSSFPLEVIGLNEEE